MRIEDEYSMLIGRMEISHSLLNHKLYQDRCLLHELVQSSYSEDIYTVKSASRNLTYVIWLLRFMKRNMLSYENSDTNPTEVESVEKLVDFRKLRQPGSLSQLLF